LKKLRESPATVSASNLTQAKTVDNWSAVSSVTCRFVILPDEGSSLCTPGIRFD
jgi:hypothetical protein